MFHSRKSIPALAFTADDLLTAGLRDVGRAERGVFADGLKVTPALTVMVDGETAGELSAALAALIGAIERNAGRAFAPGVGVATEPTRDERLVLALISAAQCRDRRVQRAACYHLTAGLGEGEMSDLAARIGRILRGCGLRLCPVALSMVDALAAPGARERAA